MIYREDVRAVKKQKSLEIKYINTCTACGFTMVMAGPWELCRDEQGREVVCPQCKAGVLEGTKHQAEAGSKPPASELIDDIVDEMDEVVFRLFYRTRSRWHQRLIRHAQGIDTGVFSDLIDVLPRGHAAWFIPTAVDIAVKESDMRLSYALQFLAELCRVATSKRKVMPEGLEKHLSGLWERVERLPDTPEIATWWNTVARFYVEVCENGPNKSASFSLKELAFDETGDANHGRGDTVTANLVKAVSRGAEKVRLAASSFRSTPKTRLKRRWRWSSFSMVDRTASFWNRLVVPRLKTWHQFLAGVVLFAVLCLAASRVMDISLSASGIALTMLLSAVWTALLFWRQNVARFRQAVMKEIALRR